MLPGRYRIEVSGYSLERQISKNHTTSTHSYGFSLIRGITHQIEFEIGINAFSHQEGTPPVFGRIKYNLFGNDSGAISASLIPKFAHTGTLGGNRVTGGLNIPIDFSLSDKISLTTMPEWDYIVTQTGKTGFHQYLLGIVLCYDVSEAFYVFLQNTEQLGVEEKLRFDSFSGAGVGYMITPRWQIDLSFDYGKNHETQILRFASGTTYEF